MATCFKYSRRGTGKNACRFGMPRDLAPSSTVDEFGIIHQRRNDAWINPWNPAIASCIRSNHDISWIPTVSKSLSLIYYITNYATKDDISPEQMLAKAALLKQSIEKARVAEHPTAAETRLREKGMDQFALRCFNTLANHRKISGVQVANTLLQYPDSYTVGSRFFSINLWWLRRYVRGILYPENPDNDNTSVPVDDEPCRYEAGEAAPISAFDNYKWRGSILASLSLYEYCMMVQTRNNRSARADDIDFDSSHPRCDTFIQHLAHNPSDLVTVTFNGQLTEYQTEEDSVAGGHPKTDAIMNDIAEILLGLFVPWDKLPLLFLQHATQLNPYTRLWTAVEPTLPPHIRDFARNIELLRKSKEDCKLDAVLRDAAGQMADDSFDRDVDELDVQDFDLEDEDGTVRNDDVDVETLIAAYDSIRNRWNREALLSADRIPALAHTSISPPDRQLSSLLPLDISNTSIAPPISGLQFFPQTTLQTWESRLKHVLKSEEGEEDAPQGVMSPNGNVDDFDLELESGTLLPTLTCSDATCIGDRRLLVGHNPTGASLTKLVCEDIPLNFKQRLVVEQVLSEALAWKDHPDGESKRQQFRLLVLGEAGVGKSWIIKGIKAGMDLVDRKKEVIVMAPTGLASNKIGGSTYHTALGIPIMRRKERTTVPPRVRRLWSGKTIMFVDELGMIDLQNFYLMNRHCNLAKSVDKDSTELWGGLPVVIFLGDFYQFPPVQGLPLWKQPSKNNNNEVYAHFLWRQFNQVVILDEQMRQSSDPAFREFLSRARVGAFTNEDLEFLNSKVISSLDAPELDNATVVAKRHILRHQVIRIRMEPFAKNRDQKICIFPALHTRTKSNDPTSRRLRVDELLELQDDGSKIPFPGLFFYTQNMPVVMLSNACTPLGQVNGATGTAAGIVIDPTGRYTFPHNIMTS